MRSKTSKLSPEIVKHIAKLARLTLTDSEIKKFQEQLSAILDYVASLQKVDTTKIEPTSQVTGLENIFRKDEIEHSLGQKEVLSNAKNKYNGYFKIKAIF